VCGFLRCGRGGQGRGHCMLLHGSAGVGGVQERGLLQPLCSPVKGLQHCFMLLPTAPPTRPPRPARLPADGAAAAGACGGAGSRSGANCNASSGGQQPQRAQRAAAPGRCGDDGGGGAGGGGAVPWAGPGEGLCQQVGVVLRWTACGAGRQCRCSS
jgi:hypothetical protein